MSPYSRDACQLFPFRPLERLVRFQLSTPRDASSLSRSTPNRRYREADNCFLTIVSRRVTVAVATFCGQGERGRREITLLCAVPSRCDNSGVPRNRLVHASALPRRPAKIRSFPKRVEIFPRGSRRRWKIRRAFDGPPRCVPFIYDLRATRRACK